MSRIIRTSEARTVKAERPSNRLSEALGAHGQPCCLGAGNPGVDGVAPCRGARRQLPDPSAEYLYRGHSAPTERWDPQAQHRSMRERRRSSTVSSAYASTFRPAGTAVRARWRRCGPSQHRRDSLNPASGPVTGTGPDRVAASQFASGPGATPPWIVVASRIVEIAQMRGTADLDCPREHLQEQQFPGRQRPHDFVSVLEVAELIGGERVHRHASGGSNRPVR